MVTLLLFLACLTEDDLEKRLDPDDDGYTNDNDCANDDPNAWWSEDEQEGDLEIRTPDQMDEFCRGYCSRTVRGDVLIEGSSLEEMKDTDLACLTAVGGSIKVTGNERLRELRGMNHVTSVGAQILIDYNDDLQEVDFLRDLTEAVGVDVEIPLDGYPDRDTGTVEIENNKSLVSFTNPPLEAVGWLSFQGNAALENIDSLQHLKLAYYMLQVEDNDSLNSLPKLGSEEDPADIGHVRIVDNPSLEWLEADIGPVESAILLYIEGNAALSSLEDFSVGDGGLPLENGFVGIVGNPLLTDLSGLSGLGTVGANPSGEKNYGEPNGLRIDDNDSLTDLHGLEGLQEIYGDLIMEGNARLSDISALLNLEALGGTCSIGENPKLSPGQIDALEANLSVTCSD